MKNNDNKKTSPHAPRALPYRLVFGACSANRMASLLHLKTVRLSHEYLIVAIRSCRGRHGRNLKYRGYN